MANKNLFSNRKTAPPTNTFNNAGGKAYKMTDKHTLAQIAVTNCFNGTYYVDGSANLQLVKEAVLALRHDPEFVARTAIYCRSKAYMKDMPAFLCAVLAAWGETELFRKVFDSVIDNAKMLRNFVQIGRSYEAGKVLNMSSGAIRKAINNWFRNRSPEAIFRSSIGQNPSMKDVLKMARPKPENKCKEALYAYLCGSKFDEEKREFVPTYNKEVRARHKFTELPSLVQQYENFKKDHQGEIPSVDFRMLDSILTKDEAKKMWKKQAETASWQTIRMNLNNFSKYGVFDYKELVQKIASKLSNKDEIHKSKCYPYQLLVAYMNATNVPIEVSEALQDAMEHSIENVPNFDGKLHICVDTSGSMTSPITGNRGSVSTAVKCVDVAALFASSILRKNRTSNILLFDTSVYRVNLNPRDTVLSNAKKMNRFGGGTDCACSIRELNKTKEMGDAIIMISDNESWRQATGTGWYRGTGMMEEWRIFKKRNSNAKLILIDLTPGNTSQVLNDKDILMVGGFGDQVFDVISDFIKNGHNEDGFVEVIEEVEI